LRTKQNALANINPKQKGKSTRALEDVDALETDVDTKSSLNWEWRSVELDKEFILRMAVC
jgi:hypothetical protein